MNPRRRLLAFGPLGMLWAPLARGAEARVKIGFFGGSHSHAWAKVQIALRSPRYELAGIWEPDAALRAKYEAAGAPALSRGRILDDASIQVIAVESDVMDHAAHAQLALDAGKHVHLEKPPADTLEKFRALVELAGRNRRLMQMGYMWRYNPAINTVLRAAREGWLGEIYLVRGMINTAIAAERRPEWARFRGGQMFELGSHLVDPLARLMGRPTQVTAVLRKHGKYNDDLKDNTAATFEWPRALGIITSATLQPGAGAHRSFEILGSNGAAVVRPIEPPTLRLDLAKAAGPYAAGSHDIPMPPYRRYEDDFAELAAAVSEGAPLSVTPREDLLVHETLMRACSM